MRFALGEIRRAKLRFALLIAEVAVALLLFLVFFQQTLADKFLGQFTGGLQHQSGSILVYNADARREGVTTAAGCCRSRPPPSRRSMASQRCGCGLEKGRSALAWRPVRIRDTTIFGYELDGPGLPTTLSEGRLPQVDGEAVASSQDAAAGYGIGDRVTIVPGERAVTIVGLANDLQFNVQPTLFVSFATSEDLVLATTPVRRPYRRTSSASSRPPASIPQPSRPRSPPRSMASKPSIARPPSHPCRASPRSSSRSASSSASRSSW